MTLRYGQPGVPGRAWLGGPRRTVNPTSAAEVRATGLWVTHAAARLSVALVATVSITYGALSFVGAYQSLDDLLALEAAGLTLGILLVQLGYFSRPRGLPGSPRATVLALVAMAALVYLPMLMLAPYWSGFMGFMGASLLLGLPLRLGVPGFVLVLAGSALVQRRFGADELEATFAIAYSMSSTFVTGLVIFGLTRLAQLVRELHDARDELSRMAVAEERLRFSRDAHDLLGMSLSAVTLKAELAHRLVLHEPDRARTELADVLGLSRRALAEVRMVASGATSLSLPEELRSARSVLTAAEIDASVRGEDAPLPPEIATLFAALLREAITNVLRHSKADVCQVSVSVCDGTARFAVTNDRADEEGQIPDERRDDAHRGLGNLRDRFVEHGGDLTTVREDGEFTVVGTVPV